MVQIGNNLAEAIRNRFSKKSEAVKQLSEWFNLSEDVIHRRFRGNTPFTLEEAIIASKKLNISLDAFVHEGKQKALVNYHFYDKSQKPFQHFLTEILSNLEKIIDLEEVEFYYTTKGLPLFLYLTQPEMLAFKLFVWEIGSWNGEKIKGEQFDFDQLSAESMVLANKISEYYCRIPSYEIWNKSILDSSFEQIEYIRAINLFKDKSIPAKLLDILENLVDKASQLAECGIKSEGEYSANFHLYHAELLNTVNNVIFVKSKNLSFVNWTFCDPDYISSYDKRLCERAERWIENQIEQSNKIATHSFRIRNEYFTQLKTKIETARKTIL